MLHSENLSQKQNNKKNMNLPGAVVQASRPRTGAWKGCQFKVILGSTVVYPELCKMLPQNKYIKSCHVENNFLLSHKLNFCVQISAIAPNLSREQKFTLMLTNNVLMTSNVSKIHLSLFARNS